MPSQRRIIIITSALNWLAGTRPVVWAAGMYRRAYKAIVG